MPFLKLCPMLFSPALSKEALCSHLLTAALGHLHLYTEIKEENISITVELQWLEHLWDHKNMFETGVVRANEC